MRDEFLPAVYIMANKRNGTLYIGVTSNLTQRVYQHKQLTVDGFSKKYKCIFLVYYETCEDIFSAIEREKQLKANSRKTKINLIENMNPYWNDLYELIL